MASMQIMINQMIQAESGRADAVRGLSGVFVGKPGKDRGKPVTAEPEGVIIKMAHHEDFVGRYILASGF